MALALALPILSIFIRGNFRLRMTLAAAALVVLTAPIAQAPASDNLIVPGERTGPVKLDSTVDEIVKALGRPDLERRSKSQPKDLWDVVTYGYNAHCLSVTWHDNGLRPQIDPLIVVSCPRWQMANGLTVGSSIDDVLKAMGQPDQIANCKTDNPDCFLSYNNSGVLFRTRDRYSPVYEIYVTSRR
jgi:hypothetical protein